MSEDVASVVNTYAAYIRANSPVTRDQLIAINLGDQFKEDADRDRKMRTVDSFVQILMSQGMVTDNGTATTWAPS